MRKLILAGVALVAVLVAATAMFFGGSSGDSASADSTVCDPSLSTPAGGSSGTGDIASGLSAAQVKVVTTIVAAGNAQGIPVRGIVVALAVAQTESGYRNLANPNVPESLNYPHDATGDDHDSLGPFQQRPSQGWGTVAQLMDVATQAKNFYTHLANVSGWQSMEITVAAQAVQRSATPTAYAAAAQTAAALAAKYAGVTDVSGCSSTGSAAGGSANIVQRAEAEIGVPYVWNGGDQNGPTLSHSGCDAAAIGGCSAVGFDCSGLALYAWAPYVLLPHSSAAQYNSGTKVPVAQATPGALLFWATNPSVPSSIHHVAIYAGNNQMIEAPESGQRVHLTPVRRNSELMPYAVAPPAAAAAA